MILQDLTYKIGDFSLSIPHLELADHSITGLIGSNGCGKSTLAGLLAGVITPDTGRIDYRIGGQVISQRERTLVSQQPYLLHDSLLENLLYPLRIRSWSKFEINKKMEQMYDLLHQFHLYDKLTQPAHSLSGGEKQKLAFLRALIFEPRLIVLDETTAGLDPDSSRLFTQTIQNYHRRIDSTWLIISHQLTQISILCQDTIFMQHGKVVSQAAPEKLFREKNPALRSFLKESQLLL